MATHLAAAPNTWPGDAPPLDAVVVFGYPLNPPGGSKSSPDRVSHLLQLTVPMLIVQGTRDSFGGPKDVKTALGARTPLISIHEVEGGDHSFTVSKSARRPQADVDAAVLDAITAWISRLHTPSGA